MFSDPFVAVMAMLILCFFGILVMFVFVIRSLSSQAEEMRESFRKQQMFLADLESQFMEMSFTLRRLQEGAAPQEGNAGPGGGELPILRQDDELLSMLEAAAKKTQPGPGYDDHLLPPPAVARPLAEEYDPLTDPHLFEDSLLAPPRRPGVEARTKRGGGRAGRSPLSIKLDD